MPSTIRIDELTLVTPSNRFEYRFSTGINAVVGEVGSGKSSMLELIKYAFGGNGVITPAVRQGVRRVVLEARVGRTALLLERGIGESTVRVLEPDGTPVDQFAVGRSTKMRNISSLLLDLLELPELRVTSVRPSKKSQPLSFFDLYAYCYVRQAEIDRSVVNHLESVMRSKRVGAFEVLLGLTDDSISSARVRLGQLRDETMAASEPLATIDQFLLSAETPTAEELHRRRESAETTVHEAEAQLDYLRSTSLAATAESEGLRERLSTTARAAAEVAERIQELEAAASTRRQLRAELASDLSRLDRTASAVGILGGIAFVQCPRCLQSLSPDRFSSDHCGVCGQEDTQPDLEPDRSVESERKRIAELRAELDDLGLSDSTELDDLLAEQRTITVVLREIQSELDRQTRDLVSPRYEALEVASAAAATARVELAEAGRLLQLWEQRAVHAERVQDLRAAAEAAQAEIDSGLDRLASRRSRVNDLSVIFDEIIQELNMPWYDEGARIDSKTYLPVVNGVSIEQLGSGGMKMMTNVAYHLALLTYGLSEGLPSIPNLLIIDSPRKNLGTTAEDQAHSNAFYDWITALTDAYSGRFQIIVADNDAPPPQTQLAETIHLSHALPLVQDLAHPGGTVETINT